MAVSTDLVALPLAAPRPVRSMPAANAPAALNEPAGTAASGIAEDTYREWLFPGADDLFRGIYGRIRADRPEVLAVCSAIAGEGKTSIALGLGVTVAEDHLDQRVLVIETDLLHPVLAQDFGCSASPGLADCLLGDTTLAEACRPTFLENLSILPAGEAVSRPSRVLHSQKLVDAIRRARQLYDLVILDVPALLTMSAAPGIANQADGALVVIRAGVTPAPSVEQAIKRLDPGKLRGVVLNEAHSRTPLWIRRLCGL